ncbi:MAG TPA: AAA family ATPase [Edaphobacter sp.]|nr:AAA family ATPase [Edaphobacter sp.]
MTPASTQDPDSLNTSVLSVALIGPEDQRRNALGKALAESQATVTKELSSYPELDDVPRLMEDRYDAIIVEIDSNPEHALDLIESICGNSSSTVMVYSAHTDPELMVRCMRAGAREFLTQPFAADTIAEALIRVSVRRQATHVPKKLGGKLLVFVGAKGGSGITTIASNFAVSLAQESGKQSLLIDLDLPLGDAALDLGITAPHSTANALQNFRRLDSSFLSKLLVKHSSGLSVLAASDKYVHVQLSDEAVGKLLTVARQDFDYVVIDAGSRLGLSSKILFEEATTIYLVTQISISELRNSNRLISEFFQSNNARLEIVLNRFTPRTLGINEEHITKALTMPVKWKVPNDYPSVLLAENTATPLVLADSPISRVIKKMARAACGLPEVPEKKKLFGLFG